MNQRPYTWTIDHLKPQANEYILEIGYGPGLGIAQLHDIVKDGNGKVYGIDLSETMQKKASLLNQTAINDGKVFLQLRSAEKTKLSSDQFDAIIGVNVAYFFDNPLVCLVELLRVLRSGGRAAFYLTDKACLDHLPNSCFTKYDGTDFASVMTHAGFTNVTVDSMTFLGGGREKVGHCVMGTKP